MTQNKYAMDECSARLESGGEAAKDVRPLLLRGDRLVLLRPAVDVGLVVPLGGSRTARQRASGALASRVGEAGRIWGCAARAAR